MRAATRLATWACALGLTMGAAGCATKKFAPSPFSPEARKTIPSETIIELRQTGNVCKRANGPYAMIGLSDTNVVWKVTNNCQNDAMVFIEKFKVKHKLFHLFPFDKPIPGTAVPAGQTVSITAHVRHTDTVTDQDMKGFQVYKYDVRIRVGNVENNDDPEIILDWP